MSKDVMQIENPGTLPEGLQKILDTGIDSLKLLVEHLGTMQLAFFLAVMEAEVKSLCGVRRKRDNNKQHKGRYERWGSRPGSIMIGDERVKVSVPRVQDRVKGKARPLETYKLLHKPNPNMVERIARKIVYGISQRNYKKVATEFVGSFGLSASSISRKYKSYSAQVLKEQEERNLAENTFVALLLDGKYFQGVQVLICVGITETGEKIVVGMVETATENAEAVQGLLQDLIDRGLRYDKGLLVILDGSKGLRKAVKAVFGDKAQVQRCTWHKRENVVSYIEKEAEKVRVRGELQQAYDEPNYDKAKDALLSIKKGLKESHPKAANSLSEGLEETLTLHRLGVAEELGRSLQTNNIMENLNSLIAQRCRNVARWMNSSQRQRWAAMANRESETWSMKILPCADHLPELQAVLL